MAVNPATGKTHTRHCRFLANGYDLSGDMRSVDSFGASFEQSDATGWDNGTRQWLNGIATVTLDGVNALFDNNATGIGPLLAGAHTVLAPGGTFYNSVFIGIRAAPVIGNPAFSAVFEQGGYSANGGGAAPVMVSGSYYASAVLPLAYQVWGHALAVGTELSATGQGGSVDNGALTSNGYISFLHLTQTAAAMGSNNWAFIVEHSSNDSTWSTLATFTANGSAITAERQEGTGTVNRYVRFKYTRTAGTARPWVTFIRK